MYGVAAVMLVALLLGSALVELLLLSRATELLSRVAFIPLARTRQIRVPKLLVEQTRSEAGEAAYREQPERHIVVAELPWPRDQETPDGALKFRRDKGAIAMRSKWTAKRIPAVGRVSVRGGVDTVELGARFAPSPLSTVMMLGVLGWWLVGHPALDVAIVCVGIAAMHLVSGVVALRRQLDHAEAAFALALDDAIAASPESLDPLE